MQRILIVRLSAMGDILHALPAVTALRHALPDAHLGWLVEERWQPLLRAHINAEPRSAEQPLVDAIHVARLKRWRTSWTSATTRQEFLALRRELRTAHYDTAIDLQGAIRSALFARAANAQRIFGEEHPREWIAKHFFTDRVHTQGTHVVEQDIEVASAATGLPLSYSPPSLPQDRDACIWVDHITAGASPVLINPGAGWGAKCWPAERYGAVADALIKAGHTVLVNCGPAEHDLAAAVARMTNDRARIVEGSITQLIELTRRAALMVAGDTGPLHLAAALHVPCVALFGPTDPSRNGPFATRSIVLRSALSRRDHARRTQTEVGLLTITPHQVIDAARQLLEETR